MRRSPETLIKATLGDALPAVLGLCALAFSTVASAGVTSLCDTRTIDPPDLDIPADELTVELIDLGTSAAVDLDTDVVPDTMALQAPPDVDAMLKQVFDLTEKQAQRGAHRSPVIEVPLADLSPPAIRTDAPISTADDTEAATDTDTVQQPEVATRVPGLSEDDLRRYRSKMYRTDI